MPFVITIAGLVLLIVLISYTKLHTFPAFLLIAFGTGLALGMPPAALLVSVEKGIGGTLGSITAIIALGAMLGKLVAQSGAAQRISASMMRIFGDAYLRWAFMITGFIVGLPLFYSVGFMLLAPIVITVAYRSGLPAVYLGLPMLASLSVTQGYLPPHPAPLAIMKQFEADMGLTLFYGIIVAIPAILVSGALFGATVRKYVVLPNKAFVAPEKEEKDLPSSLISYTVVLTPIVLISLSTVLLPYTRSWPLLKHVLTFTGDPVASMFLSVLLAMYLLGIRQGRHMEEITSLLGDSIKEVALLFLIFGGAGALKQVLTDAGISQAVALQMKDSGLHPLVLGWGIAAIIRVAVGSSTVSGITTAGFMAPMMASSGVAPHFMVLAIGAGSMMFSHVNDAGFWLFREYFRLSVPDTLKTWSVMETLVSVSGLAGVLALHCLLT